MVMMEIRTAVVDLYKRLKAIAANQKNREWDLASRSDEFQNELAGFVGGKKLRMTGGAEEAERVRQKRNDLALKAMFNTSAAGGPGTTVAAAAPTVSTVTATATMAAGGESGSPVRTRENNKLD